ncbi:MAG: response regulator transcription factor [Kiritimatiellae bacterium]|nr:response regulator transcription factor [Kiritimatiellia bacterium]
MTGLEEGADDYVTKPFSARELAARVRAVLRRVRRVSPQPEKVLSAGPLQVDTEQLTVTCRGTPLRLSYQEMKLLESLMRYPARIFTREALIDLIYEGQACVTNRSIDAQVKRIRKRVAEVCPGVDPIETVYGLGYRLAPELGEA